MLHKCIYPKTQYLKFRKLATRIIVISFKIQTSIIVRAKMFNFHTCFPRVSEYSCYFLSLDVEIMNLFYLEMLCLNSIAPREMKTLHYPSSPCSPACFADKYSEDYELY